MSAPPEPTTPVSPNFPPSGKSRAVVATFLVVLLGLLAYRAYSPYLFARPTELMPVIGRVDLNTADRAELMQVPGIGPGRADAILAHRATNGPLTRVDDLDQVSGIGPKTLQKLRSQVTTGGETNLETLERKPVSPAAPAPSTSGKIRSGEPPINVNTASVAELQRLPGVGPVMAQKIVDYRQGKRFESVEELRKVNRLGPKTLDGLKPFVVVK